MGIAQRILIVDDNDANRMIIGIRLKAHGYEVLHAEDGEKALSVATAQRPDLILLDIMMPKVDGIEVCRRLKSDATMPFTPIILVTAKGSSSDVVAGLEAGADEYLTKPIDQTALVARVKSVLRIKQLHDQVRVQADEIASWNKTLQQRVEQQLGEIERISRLKRFLSPQIADAILSQGEESLLESHRRDVTVVFCDLRGFTRFAESVEPEDLIAMLRDYHALLGELVNTFDGTVERFTGDGLMIWFNDPLPCPDPCERAVKMAVEMREVVGPLLKKWGRYGHDLGFGMGIARGYATMGRIGFQDHFEYTAVGAVVNLAARLCGQAEGGQILIDGKVCEAVESIAETEPAGELALKGVQRPVKAYNVKTLRT